jgi:hypothetical protein
MIHKKICHISSSAICHLNTEALLSIVDFNNENSLVISVFGFYFTNESEVLMNPLTAACQPQYCKTAKD